MVDVDAIVDTVWPNVRLNTVLPVEYSTLYSGPFSPAVKATQPLIFLHLLLCGATPDVRMWNRMPLWHPWYELRVHRF